MPAPRTGPPAIALSVAVATMLLVTACSRPPADQPLSTAPSGAACLSGDLPTKTSRRLTVATGRPASSPWFESGNPSNGEGYESAVAYAVAAELGFAADDVDWIEVPSAVATNSGEKDFDIDVDQVEITPERQRSVDFSSSYYQVPQVVLTLEGRSIAGAKTILGLRGARLGAARGSAGATAITEHLKPRIAAREYTTRDGAVRALGLRRDRRPGDRPADRPLTDLLPVEQRSDPRSAAARQQRRTVRAGPGPGQPVDVLRQPGRHRASCRGESGPAAETLARPSRSPTTQLRRSGPDTSPALP